MQIEAITIDKSYCVKIQIVSVEYGFSKRLVNGEWVNTTPKPERIEREILTLAKCFDSHEEAKKFTTTKQFKAIFKAIEKNWI